MEENQLYHFIILAEDFSGREGETSSLTFTSGENTCPSIDLLRDYDGDVIYDETVITANIYDDSTVSAKLLLEGTTVASVDESGRLEFTWDTGEYKDTDYSLVIRAWDAWGNQASCAFTMTVDNQDPPGIELDDIMWYAENETLVVTGTAWDKDSWNTVEKVSITVEKVSATGEQGKHAFATMSPGEEGRYAWIAMIDTGSLEKDRYSVICKARDTEWEWSDAKEETFWLNRDNILPTVSITSTTTMAQEGDEITLSADVYDADGDISSLTWRSSLTGPLSNENPAIVQLKAGIHIISVSVIDNEHGTAEDSITIMISEAPEEPFTHITGFSVNGEEAIIWGTSNQEEGIIYIDGGPVGVDVKDGMWSYTSTFTPGNHTVTTDTGQERTIYVSQETSEGQNAIEGGITFALPIAFVAVIAVIAAWAIHLKKKPVK